MFSEFHLFDSLLERPSEALDARGNALIAWLHLQHKVHMKDGAFSTRALSRGQRKRLALVVACLESRPFVIFDEWAADRDPAFKEIVCCEVLPELCAEGRCLLVISHDDRYLHLGDRLIRMENGQVTAIESGGAPPAPGAVAEAAPMAI